jgi:hypothetical protein
MTYEEFRDEMQSYRRKVAENFSSQNMDLSFVI